MKHPQVYKLIEFLPFEERSNTTSHIHDYEDSILIIRLVQASSTLFANFFIIILYHLMNKSRRNVSNYLLFFQAISDSYIGIIMCVEVVLHYLVKVDFSISFLLKLTKRSLFWDPLRQWLVDLTQLYLNFPNLQILKYSGKILKQRNHLHAMRSISYSCMYILGLSYVSEAAAPMICQI